MENPLPECSLLQPLNIVLRRGGSDCRFEDERAYYLDDCRALGPDTSHDQPVAPERPLRAKFARLTRLEEAKGLDVDASRIGTLDGWEAAFAGKGPTLRGHRLKRRSQGSTPK